MKHDTLFKHKATSILEISENSHENLAFVIDFKLGSTVFNKKNNTLNIGGVKNYVVILTEG